MADIVKANSSADIKNGTAVVSCTRTGNYDTLNTYVNNKPILADIESKYAARFDDPSYYYGDGEQGT